ncbi:type II toxin-antitoxin system Phd/YefM family antitoxin [Mumia sp. DW29H23]|uniref:type II toxin-antitoxin system Phd/YefM family antitoxin n=1 Tax=Mumia sp. DW29H23 TaxID=3421241 RepID=UPI003D68ACE0
MTSVPLSEAKDRLSGLVDEVQSTHEIVTITRHGKPAAVVMAAEDLESLHETIAWLSQDGIADAIRSAERELAAGETTSAEDLRSEFGLGPAR